MHIADFFAVAAVACLFAGAVCDMMRFEIPDALSIGLLAAAIGYGAMTPGFGWGWHGLSIAATFAFGLLSFSRGWLGGGDVKLLTGVAAWASIGQLLLLMSCIAIAGGVLAVVLLAARGGLKLIAANTETPRVFRAGAPLPYAVAIAGGSLWWAGWTYPPL